MFTITMAMMTMITNVEKRKIDQKISEWKEQLKGKDPKVTFKRLAFINLFVAISALIIYDPIINFGMMILIVFVFFSGEYKLIEFLFP